MDGADTNRQFIKVHFNGRDPVADKFITTNIHTGTPMVFITDPKVNIHFFYLISLTCIHVMNVLLPVNWRTTSGRLHFRMNISL